MRSAWQSVSLRNGLSAVPAPGYSRKRITQTVLFKESFAVDGRPYGWMVREQMRRVADDERGWQGGLMRRR